MKRTPLHITLLFLLGLLSVPDIHAQDAARNYVMTKTMHDAAGSNVVKDIQYFDDLGRPTLQSNDGLGMNGATVYTNKEYNRLGRLITDYLPYRYYAGEDDRYIQHHYDGLGRVTFSDSPGTDWKDNDKGISIIHTTNAAQEVRHYRAPLGSTSLTEDGFYSAGTLYVEKTTDEDGHFVATYTDMLGRKVLERRNGNSDTYYVYNDKSQLRYVLTPEYQLHPHKELFAYEYRYDERGRLEKKLLPQCGTEQNYYDEDDHLIYRQDAKGQFFFFLYDGIGRLAIRGTCSNFNYHHYQDVTIQNGQDGLYGTGYVFSNPSSITHGFPEEVIYYDDYSFLSKTMFISSPFCTALTMSNPVNAMGLQTGSIRRTSNNEYLLTAVYYDNKGRVIDKRETLLSGGVRKTLTTYSFTGKPLTETFVLTRNNTTTTVAKTRTYHAANDQVASLSLSYNNASPVTVAQYDYDALGRLSTIYNGGSAGNVNYTYNQRGWVNVINGPGFKEWLHYTDGVGTPCYSGNLSSQLWQGGSETFKRGYKFSYDDLSRMTRADYGEGDNLTNHTSRYSEMVLEYTKNSGIRKLERYGKKYGTTYGKIDNLRMYYHGMQVDSVKEDALPLTYTGAFDFVSKTIPTNGVQYSYYDDGSLRWDANKGVTRIDYSRFGYPERVQFHNGNVTEYAYTPDGEKHRVIYRTAVPNISVSLGHTYNLNNSNTLSVDSINYVGDFLFENGQLSKFLFEGGYATIANGQPTYHYYTKDHLGNNRAVVNHNGTVEQVVHYYPFGAVYSDAGTADALQRYKYNGKELDRMHGLNQYDYGARNYDPLMCRFTQMDPLAETTIWQSPYVYGRNNPLRFIDPDGNEDEDIYAGFIIGTITNIIPFSSSLRNLYSPKNVADYNTALQTTDKTFMTIGTAMSDAGKGGAALGLATVTAGGTAIIGSAGAATVAGGAAVVGGGVLTAAGTAMGLAGSVITMNATNNKNVGYDNKNQQVGKGTNVNSKTIWKSKGKDKARIDLENPKGRKGQIHIHIGNNKYYYNCNKKTFMDAPQKVNDLLKRKDIQDAISKGQKYLDE